MPHELLCIKFWTRKRGAKRLFVEKIQYDYTEGWGIESCNGVLRVWKEYKDDQYYDDNIDNRAMLCRQ